jgi:hypothetical protein
VHVFSTRTGALRWTVDHVLITVRKLLTTFFDSDARLPLRNNELNEVKEPNELKPTPDGSHAASTAPIASAPGTAKLSLGASDPAA